jgi:predicted lipoprotein with Yx(FWY)xxD motif
MRKSGWTVATGLGSLVLLLTACGGSSNPTSTTGTSAAAGTPTQSTAVSSASTGSSSAPASSTSSSAKSSPASTANAKATHSSSSPKQTAEAQPSSNAEVTFPPVGTTVLIVQHSNVGWVMAKASGYVVYTYAKDSKGGAPTCTGSCASVWAPVTGVPKAGPADTFPGTFGLVTGAGGVKVITYNGYPLYTYVGAPPLSTKGNDVGGVWHVIPLSESDISG